jgi:hypothetical protein
MSAVATAEATATVATQKLARSAAPLFEPSGSTLEDRILGAWEDLTAFGRAECPVCRGELEPSGCGRCGSELS